MCDSINYYCIPRVVKCLEEYVGNLQCSSVCLHEYTSDWFEIATGWQRF